MQIVVCGHCRTSVAPRADGICPACGGPADGSEPAGGRRPVDLGPLVDPHAAARREEIRHLLLGVLLVAGGIGALALSWILLSGDSVLWKAVMLVAVAMVFRGIWEWSQVDGQVAAALVVCLLAAALGLPARRGPTFFPVAAVAALYGAIRLYAVFRRRRRDRVPPARVHTDERR